MNLPTPQPQRLGRRAELVRRLSRYVMPYKGLILTAIALAIVSALMRVVAPMISQHQIDRFMPADTQIS